MMVTSGCYVYVTQKVVYLTCRRRQPKEKSSRDKPVAIQCFPTQKGREFKASIADRLQCDLVAMRDNGDSRRLYS